MLPAKNPFSEAVAALLYNLIYDQDPGEGWTPDSEPDPSYRTAFLNFAEALLQLLETADTDVSDKEVVQRAAKSVDRSKAGWSWDTIAIDEKLVSLSREAENYVDAVRSFLECPQMSVESAFLGDEAYEE